MARKKLTTVRVYFKYTENGAVPNSFSVKFPIVTFDGEDLKGRTAKPDEWWCNFAVEQYNKETGKKVRGKDFSVERIFESKESYSCPSGHLFLKKHEQIQRHRTTNT